ncbi:MAG: DUF1801 domain-containing protein [Chloroflexi bacterium]|nr:DUF1801 domain-containing protein [Chloroflexota bacterium]
MAVSKGQFRTIDEYINTFPEVVGNILQSLRQAIKEEAPEAVEAISYQMPTFKLNSKNLVHFAAWKDHIGFYPTPSTTEEFQTELAPYRAGKGSIQFPIDQPLPMPLIRKIVRFRVKEQQANQNKRENR